MFQQRIPTRPTSQLRRFGLAWFIGWSLCAAGFIVRGLGAAPLREETASRREQTAVVSHLQNQRPAVRTRTKNIEDIRPGERVMAFDHATGAWQPCAVLQRYERDYTGDIVTLTVGRDTIEATGNHPFWVVAGESLTNRPKPEHVDALEPASTIGGRWVDARDLQNGDQLQLASGDTTEIRFVHARIATVPVYNLNVAEYHTYAVGRESILVHNRNPHLQGLTPQPGTRGTGVSRARALEVELVQKTGKGTVDWTPAEIEFIKRTGRLPDGTVGHHINNVADHPDWAGDPRNIKFVRGQAGNLAEHGGNFGNGTEGPLVDRQGMIDAANRGGAQ